MQLAAIKLPRHCHAQGFCGLSMTSSAAWTALRLLEVRCSSSHPLGLQVASLMKEKTLKTVILTRQLKEKNQFAVWPFLLHWGKTVPCNLRGPINTSLCLFWWFGTHLSVFFQLLENWEVCFNKHKIQLCMVRDVDNLILCGQGEHYCPVMFLAGTGDKSPLSLKQFCSKQI